MDQTPQEEHADRVECKPTKDPAVRWLILAAMMIGFAVWCYSDRRPMPDTWDIKHINEVSNYLFNNWGPVLFAPVGLIALFAAIRQLTRTLIADQEGIKYGNGSILWSDIETIDAAKLRSKGLLKLISGDGSAMKLHSWKMTDFKLLVEFIESKCPEAKKISEH